MKPIRSLFATLAVAVVLTASPVHAASNADLYRASYQLEAQGKYAEALAKMTQVTPSARSRYFVTVRLAWLSYLSGRYDQSATQYHAAAALEPKAVEPKIGLTLPLMAQRKWKELEKACAAVLKIDPRHGVARARLAHAHYMVGNYPDAAVVYRGLIEDYPAELDHQTGLGWAIARMGRVAEAKKIFEAVLEVSPDNPNAKQGMAL